MQRKRERQKADCWYRQRAVSSLVVSRLDGNRQEVRKPGKQAMRARHTTNKSNERPTDRPTRSTLVLHATRNWRALDGTEHSIIIPLCVSIFCFFLFSYFLHFPISVYLFLLFVAKTSFHGHLFRIHCRRPMCLCIVSFGLIPKYHACWWQKLTGEEISTPAHHHQCCWLWKVALALSARHNANDSSKSFSLRCAYSKTNYSVGKIALISVIQSLWKRTKKDALEKVCECVHILSLLLISSLCKNVTRIYQTELTVNLFN